MGPLVVTFALRGQDSFPETFELRATVKDAKKRLSTKWQRAQTDIVLLHHGKALGDQLILSRLRLPPERKIHVFLKDLSTFVLRPARAMCLEPQLNEVFTLVNLMGGDSVRLDLERGMPVAQIREVLAGRVRIENSWRITILNGLEIIKDGHALRDVQVTNIPFEFTVSSPAVGEFVALREQDPQDESGTRARLGEKVMQELSPSEQQAIREMAIQNLTMHEAAVIFLRTNRNFKAVRTNATSS